MLGVAWLGVFGFSAVPVFMFYNIWSTCEVIKAPQSNGTAGVEQICVDIRQYGTPPPSLLLCARCLRLHLRYCGRGDVVAGCVPALPLNVLRFLDGDST